VTAAARWEHFEHEADMGVRGYGATLAEAFEQGAMALTGVVADPAGVRPETPVAITLAGSDVELLFVEWLNAVIYEMAIRSMLFSRFEVRIADGRVSATAWGEDVDVERHQPAVEVKGATLTALRVAEDESHNWVAQCIVDV
jgi:SHS2 domain-containing protein